MLNVVVGGGVNIFGNISVTKDAWLIPDMIRRIQVAALLGTARGKMKAAVRS